MEPVQQEGPEPVRAVMVLPAYLPESFGGAEQQCRKLSQALSRIGVRVTILAPRLCSETPAREQEGDVEIRRFRVRKAPNLGGRYIGSLLAWSAKVIWWLLAHGRDIDIVHVFHGRLHALPAVVGSSLIGKPSLVKIGRGGDSFDLGVVRSKRLIGRAAYRTILNHADGYIANSREIVDDLLEHAIPPDRIVRVANGVEIAAARADHECAPIERLSPRNFVYLGRLDPEKRIDIMLEGFARFSDTSATLTIVGDGESRAQLERLASKLGLGGRVQFPGRTDDVARYLRPAHFYLSTSASEGMSNALLEAMSFGVVPLVSEVSGAKDIVEHGRSGFLFEPGNLDDFVSKLELTREAVKEDYRAMCDSARESIRQKFGIDRIADAHLHIYRTALSGSAFLQLPPPTGMEATAENARRESTR
jgi:glycosyltransferase involved in cell wall biosynthesis